MHSLPSRLFLTYKSIINNVFQNRNPNKDIIQNTKWVYDIYYIPVLTYLRIQLTIVIGLPCIQIRLSLSRYD